MRLEARVFFGDFVYARPLTSLFSENSRVATARISAWTDSGSFLRPRRGEEDEEALDVAVIERAFIIMIVFGLVCHILTERTISYIVVLDTVKWPCASPSWLFKPHDNGSIRGQQ